MARVFIIDPVCAMEYGHSLNALKYFADLASHHFDEVNMVASQHLPRPADGSDDGVIRFFDFHYDYVLKIDRAPAPLELMHVPGQRLSPEAAATVEFSRFMTAYDIGPEDTLLYPSIDHYSALSLANVVGGLHPHQCPALLVRMIAVMEMTALNMTNPDAFTVVIDRLKGLLNVGLPLSICAETPTFGNVLRQRLGQPVHIVPYFAPGIDPLDIPQDGPITFLSGGSARPDKGFFRLKPIIEGVLTRLDPSQVRFIIQGPPDATFAAHTDYMRWLYSLPNAEILPGQVPYTEIVRSFRDSHVALMPYAQDVYANRGSAMLMEALMFGRLAICQAGTGFADQARLYNAGATCGTEEDFADAIVMFAQKSPGMIREQAALARRYYLEDVDRSCKAWIKAEAA